MTLYTGLRGHWAQNFMKQGPQFFGTKRRLHMSASAPKMPQLISRDIFISVHPKALCELKGIDLKVESDNVL